MQIGDNLYINLVVGDSNVTDTLEPTDIITLKLAETAGASLPYIYMSFVSKDQKLTNSIQLGNEIKISIGNTAQNADTFDVSIIPSKPTKDPSGSGWLVEIAGFIGNKAYMIEQLSRSYFGSSFLAVDHILKDYLGKPKKGKHYVQTNFTRVKESQVYWRRNSQTACTFVVETLLHADVRPSFPLFAFDKYKNFYVQDLTQLMKDGAKYTFSVNPSNDSNVIQYFNDFKLESFQEEYNLYSGYNKMTEVYDSATGLAKYIVDENVPILASSSEAQESYVGNVVQMNDIQSCNVHKTYNESFVWNTNKLMALSSELGALVLHGKYYKDLKPLDLVKVDPGEPQGVLADPTSGGYYLIDSIITEADFSTGGIRTIVYVTRDNKNNVENYAFPAKKKGINVLKSKRDNLLRICHSIKTVYSMGMRFFDGRFLQDLMSFAVETKYNVLHSFRVDGFITDFTSSANLINSLIGAGNSLMNKFIFMVLPSNIAATLVNFIIDRPSLIDTLLQYIEDYVDPDVVDVANLIANSIYGGTIGLNDIAKDNLIFIVIAGGVGATTTIQEEIEDMTKVDSALEETTYQEERQPDVNDIIDDFQNNTTGLDLPFPRITLTESESILPEEELRDVVANKTIENLATAGYLKDVDKEKLKQILLGDEPIDFNIINSINASAGETMNYRFWGSYNDVTELSSFFVKESFKDKYRTIPCTKLVSATRNAKIFFACPETETDLRFYINSKRVEMESFKSDLGYTDAYKNKIIYNIYYNSKGYNSNSVLFEVRQGGMV